MSAGVVSSIITDIISSKSVELLYSEFLASIECMPVSRVVIYKVVVMCIVFTFSCVN